MSSNNASVRHRRRPSPFASKVTATTGNATAMPSFFAILAVLVVSQVIPSAQAFASNACLSATLGIRLPLLWFKPPKGQHCRKDPSIFAASIASDGYFPELTRLQQDRRTVAELLGQRRHRRAFLVLKEMLSHANRAESALVDDAIQEFCQKAFRSSGNENFILQAVELIHLQLASNKMNEPYHLVPRLSLLHALRALSSIQEPSDLVLDTAFRLLQRLLTGNGTRDRNQKQFILREQDFNRVLNAVSNAGRMDMAHKIVALMERTGNKTQLCPVSFSILIKGYGRLGDVTHVDMLVRKMKRSNIVPDTILLNSLVDAYVNCQALAQAQDVFAQMLEGANDWPPPNLRTYNTLLKGLANAGLVQDALALAEEMKQAKRWDSVSTNTLVHVAVLKQDFHLAKDILKRETFRSTKERPGPHPNVEAYTELLDAYAKDGQLDKAVAILQKMRKLNVQPNEITYTCLIAGMAKENKVEEANKMLKFMIVSGLKPTFVTYNAYLSALVAGDDDTLNERVDQAMLIFSEMLKSRVRPNAVTVSTLVEALGRCNRLDVANLLLEKLEREGFSQTDNAKVVTAAVRACGAAGDIQKGLEYFGKLKKPDTIAINAMLDVCCKCQQENTAVQIFDYEFRKRGNVKPDVISYTVAMTALLKTSVSQAHRLYNEMKNQQLQPDQTLVDIILKAILQNGRSGNILKRDAYFIASVLRDAEKLSWDEGQLQQRKRASFAVMSDALRDVWSKLDSEWSDLVPERDELFERKGWNQVDSGFSLWGYGQEEVGMLPEDKFLSQHGWNDVDSGFRII